MGSVAVDTQKREREFKQLTLSDRNVVKYLIMHRSSVDISYYANFNVDITQAGDVFELNQELIALYSSLDVVIEKCNFKDKQSELLRLIFDGNTLQDICATNKNYKKSATYDLLERMVDKITKKNNELWKESMKVQGYIK